MDQTQAIRMNFPETNMNPKHRGLIPSDFP